jgi:predicted DNA-binding transcriptional regulator AlpA
MDIKTNDRLLIETEILAITTFSRSLLKVEIDSGRFPRSRVIGAKRRAWRQSDIDIWMANLKETESVDTGADKSVEPAKPGAGEIK